MVIPNRAAICANCCSVAAGVPSQPKTSVWTKPAPVSLERRCTQPVCRAAVSAVVVKRVRIVRARYGTLVIGEAPGSGGGVGLPRQCQDYFPPCLKLMPMGHGMPCPSPILSILSIHVNTHPCERAAPHPPAAPLTRCRRHSAAARVCYVY